LSTDQPEVVIDDDDELYRRLPPIAVNPDGSVNSAAYKLRKDPDPEPSVDSAKVIKGPQETLSRAPRAGFGLGVLTVREVKKLGFVVQYKPLPGNSAHCIIVGQNTRQKARAPAVCTRVIVKPGSVEP
jgi:hypothetical protein